MPEKRDTTVKKAPLKKKVTKGDSYICGLCGLAVTVDQSCGCVDFCDIICCGRPMKVQKVKAKTTSGKTKRAPKELDELERVLPASEPTVQADSSLSAYP
jgi:hypothetical protein